MEDWPPAIRCSSGRLIHLTVWIENPLASTDGSRVKTPSGPENNRLVHTTRSNRHLNVFSRLQPPCTACYWNRCNILYRWASIHFRCILNFKRLEVSYSLKKCSAFVAKCCCGRARSRAPHGCISALLSCSREWKNCVISHAEEPVWNATGLW